MGVVTAPAMRSPLGFAPRPGRHPGHFGGEHERPHPDMDQRGGYRRLRYGADASGVVEVVKDRTGVDSGPSGDGPRRGDRLL